MADLTSGEYLKDARQYSENDNLSDSQIINSYNAEFGLQADGSGAMTGADLTLSEFANELRTQNTGLADVADYQFQDTFTTYQQENNIKPRGQRDSGFEYSTDQAAKLLGSGIKAVGDVLDWDDFQDYGNNIIRQQNQDIEDGQYTSANPDSLLDSYNDAGMEEFLSNILIKVEENFATSTIPLGAKAAAVALTALNAPMIGTALFTASMLASAVMSIGESAQEQEEKTGKSNSGKAILTGIGVAGLDLLSVNKIFGKGGTNSDLINRLVENGQTTLAKKFGASIARGSAKVVKSVAIEAATEAAQESLMMKAAQSEGGEYTSDEVKERLFDSAVLGGVMGGGISAPTIASQEISNNSQANRLREIRSVEREANLKSENEVEAIKLAVREMNTRQLLGAEEQEVREKGASVRELAATLRGLTEQTNNTAKDNIEKGVTPSLDELAPGLDLETKKNIANESVDRINEEEAKSDPKTDVDSAFNARDRAIENEKNQRAPSEKDRINSRLAMMRLAVRTRQEGQPNRGNFPLLKKADNNSTDIPKDIKTPTQMQNALRNAFVKKQRDEVKATPLLEYTPNASIVLSNDAIEQKKLDVLAEKRKTQEESAIVGGRNEVKGAVIGGQSVPTRNLRYKTNNELFTKKGAELLAGNLQAKQDGSDYTVVPIRRGQVTGFAIEITPTTESVNESAQKTQPTFTPDPGLGPKSRSIAITMSPSEFLNLTPDQTDAQVDLDSMKYQREQIAKGEPLETPILLFELDDKGVATVVGHEGRHRSRILVEMGITEMPVVLRSQGGEEIRWSEQTDLTKRERIKVPWPTTLKPQEDSSGNAIAFPVSDPSISTETGQNDIPPIDVSNVETLAKSAAGTPVASDEIVLEKTTDTAVEDLQDVSPAQKIENETAILNNETAKIKARNRSKSRSKSKSKSRRTSKTKSGAAKRS